jgi:hypothetical protein
LYWIAFDQPNFAIAGAPVFLIGLRILWGVMTLAPGPAFNRLLALGGVQLMMFAALFQIICLIPTPR